MYHTDGAHNTFARRTKKQTRQDKQTFKRNLNEPSVVLLIDIAEKKGTLGVQSFCISPFVSSFSAAAGAAVSSSSE